MKNFILFSIICMFLAGCNGCEKAPANQIVIHSDDWGVTWRTIGVGEIVPRCMLAGCYNVYLPGSTMAGELVSTQRTFEGAKITLLISYQYEIIDGVLFSKDAKELWNQEGINDSSMEAIENRLIDKIFHDVLGPDTKQQKILDFDQAEFETIVMKHVNELTEKRGIRILAMSVVPKFGEQLEESIDALQALELYKMVGLEEWGKEVILRKAGSANISSEKK